MLAEVKAALNVPVATDIHEIDQAEAVATVVDLVQIPAFLCRQTDLVVAAARATAAAGGCLHLKKGQFLAPWDCGNIVNKAREVAPDLNIILCERGNSFGYNNLVVDMLGIAKCSASVCRSLSMPHIPCNCPARIRAPAERRPEAGEMACR
jgi:2-dehydro-3-deoxyphosphooctonate aldolase (KDO 8-P synthase)